MTRVTDWPSKMCRTGTGIWPDVLKEEEKQQPTTDFIPQYRDAMMAWKHYTNSDLAEKYFIVWLIYQTHYLNDYSYFVTTNLWENI